MHRTQNKQRSVFLYVLSELSTLLLNNFQSCQSSLGVAHLPLRHNTCMHQATFTVGHKTLAITCICPAESLFRQDQVHVAPALHCCVQHHGQNLNPRHYYPHQWGLCHRKTQFLDTSQNGECYRSRLEKTEVDLLFACVE